MHLNFEMSIHIPHIWQMFKKRSISKTIQHKQSPQNNLSTFNNLQANMKLILKHSVQGWLLYILSSERVLVMGTSHKWCPSKASTLITRDSMIPTSGIFPSLSQEKLHGKQTTYSRVLKIFQSFFLACFYTCYNYECNVQCVTYFFIDHLSQEKQHGRTTYF